MKTRFILYILPLLLLAGCSLEEDRESFTDRANSYQNSFQAEAVVKSCYEDVAQLFNSSSAMMMEVASDLWYQSTSVVDAISAISPGRVRQAVSGSVATMVSCVRTKSSNVFLLQI